MVDPITIYDEDEARMMVSILENNGYAVIIIQTGYEEFHLSYHQS